MAGLPLKTLLSLLPFFLQVTSGYSGAGTTTRYWDCCKPSCSWPGKGALAAGFSPVKTCNAQDNPISDPNAVSGCNGGPAYACTNQSPWAINNNLSYGYAAVSFPGGNEATWCCACYELTFTSGPVAGKKLIVQTTNTGGDLGAYHFDLAMPGGGFGLFNGCQPEFGTPSTGWGATYGGISSRSQCDAFPAGLKAGCYWRFDWFQNADNPTVDFQQVSCPAELTARTGCKRADDSGSPAPSNPPPATTSAPPPPPPPATSAAPRPTTTTTAPGGGSGGGGTGTAQKWGQCGGIGWKGPTTCVAGTTCQAQNGNPYYSQCL